MNKSILMENETHSAYLNFMKYIKQYRTDKKMTQKDMASLFDISLQHVSNLENDKYHPTFNRMIKMFKSVNNKFDANKFFKVLFPEYAFSGTAVKEQELKHLREDNERLKKIVDKLL